MESFLHLCFEMGEHSKNFCTAVGECKCGYKYKHAVLSGCIKKF